jgi:hypothetical protein
VIEPPTPTTPVEPHNRPWTAATLNPGDSLTGGAGTDTLALYGSGTFRVDRSRLGTTFSVDRGLLALGHSEPVGRTRYSPRWGH